MSKRTIGLLVAALLVLVLGVLSCSLGQVLGARLSPTSVPTRTPRPTWTRFNEGLAVATPTLDATRFPVASVPTNPVVAPTAQMVVPGQPLPLLVPQGTPGQVMTVVVVIVTATPPAPAAEGPQPGLPDVSPVPGAPAANPFPGSANNPGAPLASPTVTSTPPPPVRVHVTQNEAFVRQGPGTTYPPFTRLEKGTTITVVGRNRAGDWWKICCVNGADVWIADSVVTVDGPLWTVPEVVNIPPSPMPTMTPAASPTPAATPTYAWPFRPEGNPQSYVLNQDIFRVAAVIYDGSTPLWGYRLRIRKLSTGQEWLSDPSEAYWKYEPVEWGQNLATPVKSVKRNVKWDSNVAQVPMGNDTWEVTATDGAGNPLSPPVRLTTSVENSKWYYIVFTGRK